MNDFINDWEKMIDFFQLTRSEFLKSYSYLHEMEYDATAKRVLREGISLKDIGGSKWQLKYQHQLF